MATVGVYLILLGKDDSVFLLKRMKTGFADGFYALPSGSVEPGESGPVAAAREANEECGIVIKEEDLTLAHVVQRRKTDADERMDLFFVCSRWTGEIQNLEPHKHEFVRAFPFSDLPKPIIPYHAKALRAVRGSPLLTHSGIETYSYVQGAVGEEKVRRRPT
jgi:8-oxo-dGTP pyrophosphatase MutT (NUDIX family)